MSIEKLIAQNAADARDLWLDSLPESVEFTENRAKPEKAPSFLFGRVGKVLAAICLCSALSFVSLAEDAPNKISISFNIYDDCYKISIESNFEKRLPWKQVLFDYLPDGYRQADQHIFEYEKTFSFTEITDQPNSYTDKYYDITVLKLDIERPSLGMTHYTTWLLPEESRMDIDGNNSLILSRGITTTIYMPKENYVVMIDGTLPKDEMIKIAENISFTGDGQPPEEAEENRAAWNPLVISPIIRISLIYIAACLAVYLALAVYERGKGSKK